MLGQLYFGSQLLARQQNFFIDLFLDNVHDLLVQGQIALPVDFSHILTCFHHGYLLFCTLIITRPAVFRQYFSKFRSAIIQNNKGQQNSALEDLPFRIAHAQYGQQVVDGCQDKYA